MNNLVHQYSQLSIEQVEAYLKTNGWEYFRKYKNVISIWYNEAYSKEELIVPIDKSIGDYYIIVNQFITSLSKIENVTKNEVLDKISKILLTGVSIRLTSDDVGDGSIQYEEGLALIKNAKDLLISAALSAYKKKSYYIGTYPEVVDNYVKRIRLGQTEKGSYIVNLLAPVTQLTKKIDQLFTDKPYDHKVYYSLISELKALEKEAEICIKRPIIKEVKEYVDLGISANLCDSVINLVGSKENTTVEISITPSAYIDKNSIKTTVKMVPSYLPHLKEVSETLKKEAYYHQILIFGSVAKLQREIDREDGDIVIIGIYDGKDRQMNTHLEKIDYIKAIVAHKEKLSVKIIGDLEITMNKARIVNISLFELIRNGELEIE